MPKHLIHSAKGPDLVELKRPSVNTMLMILVAGCLLWTSGVSASGRVQDGYQVKIQEAQLCMAEYTSNKCDALKLSPKC